MTADRMSIETLRERALGFYNGSPTAKALIRDLLAELAADHAAVARLTLDRGSGWYETVTTEHAHQRDVEIPELVEAEKEARENAEFWARQFHVARTDADRAEAALEAEHALKEDCYKHDRQMTESATWNMEQHRLKDADRTALLDVVRRLVAHHDAHCAWANTPDVDEAEGPADARALMKKMEEKK